MKAKELEKHLKVIKDFQEQEDKFAEALKGIMDGYPVLTYASGLLNAYINLIQELIGDENDSIYWHIYDNEWGKNKFNYNGIKVKNASDLLKAMEVLNEQSKEK